MKAICLRAHGGPEAFAYEEAQPRPGEGEVLVRVHAAGVIHTELSWVPTWTTRASEPRPLPAIPGHEFSGGSRWIFWAPFGNLGYANGALNSNF